MGSSGFIGDCRYVTTHSDHFASVFVAANDSAKTMNSRISIEIAIVQLSMRPKRRNGCLLSREMIKGLVPTQTASKNGQNNSDNSTDRT